MTDDISKLQKSYDLLLAKYTELSDTMDGFITEINIHDNSIGGNKLVSGLKPIEIVDILPAAGTQGRIVFLTPDSKLYRDTGTAWTVAVAGADIVANSITGGQIAAATITADKYSELRNTYVFCGADSLDSTHPFILDFEIVSEMTAIQSVKLSFKLSKFRAYETGAASGGGSTSGSGGAQTSGGGGDDVTAATGHSSIRVASSVLAAHEGGYYHVSAAGADVSRQDHTHSQSSHTHSVADHTHTVADHTHGITYGIYEPTTTPTIHYHISNDGVNFGAASANYTTDQLDIAIAGISAAGFKAIRFDSDVLCRVSAWILIKVDLTA